MSLSQAPVPVSSEHQSDNRKPVTLNSVTSQNQVTTVILHGVPIVALTIDGKERLCLAQISTTLLKNYSYNEIHNRRVALGITCVQCTPVQLEILRRAGAMPISSRRCGMISKREAERLVKSFLEDAKPPQLPENFCFDVVHQCGWGATGKFMPARYNSSRAKCIKCDICNLFFSPNKFIFHYHRTPESKYHHPDAANFNSWRRHLFLRKPESEDIVHAWEDVKAMFNGGSRKRIITSSPKIPSKIPKFSGEKGDIGPYYPAMFPGHPYPFKPMPPMLQMPFDRPLSPLKHNQFWPVVPRSEFSPYNESMWLDQPLTPDSRLTDLSKAASDTRTEQNEEDVDSESDIDIMETEPDNKAEKVPEGRHNDNETEVTSSCGAKQESTAKQDEQLGATEHQEKVDTVEERPKTPASAIPDSYISRDEMLRLMQRESEARQQIELECHAMKENLYRELEQERKTRFALQQKLKEAHDALHSFSCKMLTSRPCECTFRQAAVL